MNRTIFFSFFFQVAGIPVVQHHIEALAKVDEVKEVLLLGNIYLLYKDT